MDNKQKQKVYLVAIPRPEVTPRKLTTFEGEVFEMPPLDETPLAGVAMGLPRDIIGIPLEPELKVIICGLMI